MADAWDNEPVVTNGPQLLLELAHEHQMDHLLTLLVHRLAESPRVALARIWLKRPGDRCGQCRMRPECPNQTECLHLVASAGQSRDLPDDRWNSIDGDFQRFPLGVRKVGWIAANGQPLEIPNLGIGNPWIAQPQWIQREGITGFGGQPLVHRGEIMGVLAVFARGTIGELCMQWLRTIANHAAAALATARAFAEIESLKRQLESENEYLREEVERRSAFGELIGQSAALQQVTQRIDLVAPTTANVLILGESGTGKELVARELHRRSLRAKQPLIQVNCAAIPRELYESEFFGHVRGAFTGALRDRMGRFELANGGTLFLDEIGEIPLELQAKLLRVLQEGKLERVGEERTRSVDVRIIAATNRDLRQEADAGRFRPDLYYRLSVFPIEVPPLRDRLDDLPLLAEHFLERTARQLGRPKPRLTRAVMQQMQQYHWPGNIRELQHILERSLIISAPDRFRVDLPSGSTSAAGSNLSAGVESAPLPAASGGPATPREILTDAQLRQIEAENLRAAMKVCRGKVSGRGGVAELLGVKPTTVFSRLKSLGIEPRVDF
ncbi:sigma-54-dependent Fis family transcriptional regulator [Tuwongella immobilis]|uniref:Sigma-54 factor interaction domain-containing protein n=1 Tax=Tuwongella immobilis TaxID=692036 RepID=A0A6C2YNS4_9BACT|nr:sigma 54-interacting transcriptional regulator [Tuwongella immobilis]VIP02849.1 transcriptional fis family : Sigma-54 factor interaction domain-containing protein OS=Planctomyces limnophilus (strain ATCC 43296 / DSM 3776 / IFAM 1008 / 290) GN=Plim_2667 PE=4 SV=1: GAF_2: Sigma54_activat [Tuwongella immobilis]VTS02635.1 transcriptional fis family : Sigma-54 factor interaction domain-containing protein OS=Planctomyces limnophilus (strain ATCC 43296 / DSM 3776 / IFAM 1008 / 290) GN=Plim_2667 PE=4 